MTGETFKARTELALQLASLILAGAVIRGFEHVPELAKAEEEATPKAVTELPDYLSNVYKRHVESVLEGLERLQKNEPFIELFVNIINARHCIETLKFISDSCRPVTDAEEVYQIMVTNFQHMPAGFEERAMADLAPFPNNPDNPYSNNPMETSVFTDGPVLPTSSAVPPPLDLEETRFYAPSTPSAASTAHTPLFQSTPPQANPYFPEPTQSPQASPYFPEPTHSQQGLQQYSQPPPAQKGPVPVSARSVHSAPYSPRPVSVSVVSAAVPVSANVAPPTKPKPRRRGPANKRTTLAEERRAVVERETAVAQREAQMNTREQAVNKREQEVDAREQALRRREEALKAAEQEMLTRKRVAEASASEPDPKRTRTDSQEKMVQTLQEMIRDVAGVEQQVLSCLPTPEEGKKKKKKKCKRFSTTALRSVADTLKFDPYAMHDLDVDALRRVIAFRILYK